MHTLTLQRERKTVEDIRNKLTIQEELSKEDLTNLCKTLEDTIELAAVSLKMIERLRINFSSLKNQAVNS